MWAAGHQIFPGWSSKQKSALSTAAEGYWDDSCLFSSFCFSSVSGFVPPLPISWSPQSWCWPPPFPLSSLSLPLLWSVEIPTGFGGTWENNHEFEASPEYIKRLCLKTWNKQTNKQNKFHHIGSVFKYRNSKCSDVVVWGQLIHWKKTGAAFFIKCVCPPGVCVPFSMWLSL